ncbi:hypothetical protein BC830DRAFT_822989 [Chytriomyces sp. MP71]|nr:hypothetical protein BC830DRAFT_822989 [Chytriomyces sp. MP71]
MAQSMDIIVKAGKRIVTLSQCIGEADPYNNAVLQGFFASGQFENRDKLMNVTTFPPNSSISTETTSSGSSMTTLTATYATNHLSLKSVIGTEKVASITGVRTGDVGIKSTPSRSSNASESSLQITSTALTGIIIGVVSAFLLALALLWMHLRSKRGHSRKRKHGLDSAVPLLSKRSLSFPDRPLNAMSLQPACVFDTPISQHPTQTPPRHCNPPDLSAQQNTFQQSQLSWHLFFPSLSQAQTGPWQSPSTFSSQCNQPHALSILSPFPPEQPVFQQQPRTPPAHEPTCSPPQPRIRTAIPLTSSPIPQPYAPIKRRFAQSPLIQQTTTRILSDHTESIDAFFFDFDYGDEQEAYDPAKRRINVSPSREY